MAAARDQVCHPPPGLGGRSPLLWLSRHPKRLDKCVERSAPIPAATGVRRTRRSHPSSGTQRKQSPEEGTEMLPLPALCTLPSPSGTIRKNAAAWWEWKTRPGRRQSHGGCLVLGGHGGVPRGSPQCGPAGLPQRPQAPSLLPTWEDAFEPRLSWGFIRVRGQKPAAKSQLCIDGGPQTRCRTPLNNGRCGARACSYAGMLSSFPGLTAAPDPHPGAERISGECTSPPKGRKRPVPRLARGQSHR